MSRPVPWPVSPHIVCLDTEMRERLIKLVNAQKSEQRLVRRARIVLMAADGLSNAKIAKDLPASENTVRKWLSRFCDNGVDGLYDFERSGRPKVFSEVVRAEVKALACQLPTQVDRPLSTWSGPELVRKVTEDGIVDAISASTILRWLRTDALKPWQHRTWIFPRDPNFAAKAQRVLDLYAGIWEGQKLGDGDFVVSADEKTSIQCRKRIHETLEPSQNRPMRVEFEYERDGALAYFGAWDVHQGKIMGRCEQTTGIDPFNRLVDQVMSMEPYSKAKRVFWVVDNGSSHRGQASTERMQARHENAILVHTPVHASWLNQIEIYFSILQRKVISPNDFDNLDEVEERLLSFENHYNAVSKPFDWKFDKDDLADLLRRIEAHDPAAPKPVAA